MPCPSLWKQDTRTLRCCFTHTSTSPKPSHRYDVIADLFQWCVFTLDRLFMLKDVPLFHRGLLDSAERRLQVQLEGACLTRSPAFSPPDKPYCCYWFILNNALPVVGCWTGNLVFTNTVASSPKCPLNVTSWGSVPERVGGPVQSQIPPLKAIFVFKFLSFLRKLPFFKNV